jgi:hypothetical protein
LAVQAPQGQFSQTYVPTQVGEYRLRLSLPGKTIEAAFTVLQPPLDKTPTLQEDGLKIGEWKLPLVGEWLPPRLVGGRLYLAQNRGLLILELDPQRPAVVGRHYAPAEIEDLEAEPELTVRLVGGRRLSLLGLPVRSFEGRWDSLGRIAEYQDHLAATRSTALDISSAPLPYWGQLARDPQEVLAADLEQTGSDLLARGHRPELSWGGVKALDGWLNQIAATRQTGLEASRAWSDFFLRYLPLYPGASRVLAEQAQWFEAQGRPDLAIHYRQALSELRSWKVPWSSNRVGRVLLLLGGLYLLVLMYLWFTYLPVQQQNLRSSGGYVLAWLRNPLLRLRHNTLAYTRLSERILLTLLFLALALTALAWGVIKQTERIAAQEAFARGTLRSFAAQEALRALPGNGVSKGLLAYSLAQDNPTDAEGLLAEADPWAYVRVNQGTPETLGEALSQSPGYAPAREALDLSGDSWSVVYREAGLKREGVPTPRLFELALLRITLTDLIQNFPRSWLTLPLWTADWQAWLALVGVALLFLYQLLCFVLPRPRGADSSAAWRRGVQFFFPGSPWFAYGWGLVLLLSVVLGIYGWRMQDLRGLYLALAGLVLHFVLWGVLVGWKRRGAER